MHARTATLALALALLPAGLMAQQTPTPPAGPPRPPMARGHEMGPGMGQGMGPGMGAGMARAPAEHLLRMAPMLNLSDDQVSRLQSLASKQTAARRNDGPDLLRARADLMEATNGDIDVSAARAALERMSKLRIDAAVARLQEQKDARAVLTADQKARLDAMHAQMMQPMGAMQGHAFMGRERGMRGARMGGRGAGRAGMGAPGMRGHGGPGMPGGPAGGMPPVAPDTTGTS